MARKPNGYWTFERCKEAALKCKTRVEFKRKYPVAYRKSCDNDWLQNVCYGLNYTQYPWTNKELEKEAKKYKHRSDFRKGSSGAYQASQKRGILDKICKHMKPLGHKYKRCIYRILFSDRTVYIGLSYNHNKRFIQHKQKGPVYKHMTETGLEPTLLKLTDFVDIDVIGDLESEYVKRYKRGGYKLIGKDVRCLGSKTAYTRDECFIEASKYFSRKQFSKKSNGHWARANKMGWLDFCCSHMTDMRGRWANKKIIQFSTTGKKIRVWNSISEAGNSINISGSAFTRALKNPNATAGGYKWKYANE